jgi:hypothetical protein
VSSPFARRWSGACCSAWRRRGGEFRVNTFTTGSQSRPAIAADGDGDFIIAWTSDGQDGAGEGVYARLYNADGTPRTAEFRANAYTTGDQTLPQVATDADGDFVIVWASYIQDAGTAGIYARRYDSAGVAQGGEFRVNTFTTGDQFWPSAAMDVDGDFVIAWTSNGQDGSYYGAYAQRYNAAGVPQGSEFRVNTFTTDSQAGPYVAMDASGDFVITWTSYTQDGGSSAGVYAQRYSAAGLAQGTEFRVNTYTTDDQLFPSIAMDDDGDFVITWESLQQDGASSGVYAQRYNSTGVSQGSEFRVNTHTTSSQNNPRVAMNAGGSFLVTWGSANQDGSNVGVYAQAYHATGLPQGAEFRVNTHTTSAQSGQAVVLAQQGDAVVVWHSNLQDGSNFGVYAQRYEEVVTLPATGAEFRVNTYTTNSQQLPVIAIDGDGDFVVSWASSGQDGSGFGIYAQRYGATGTAQGNEFRVNTFTTGDQTEPVVAIDADGDFVVAWTSVSQDGAGTGIFAQRFDAAGTPVGTEFRVNTSTSADQLRPAVAIDPDGNFFIVWDSNLQDGSGYGVYAQRYNLFGVPQGAEFAVNTFTTSDQRRPTVAADAVGNFVIAWNSNQDGSGHGIYAQRYNRAGATQGTEFRINTHTTSNQTFPSAAMDASGDFVVAWQSDNQDGSDYGVYAKRFNAAGVAQGAEFRVNSYTTGSQNSAAAAIDAGGDFLITWSSANQDGSSSGVYAQAIGAAGVPAGAEFRVNAQTTNGQSQPVVAMDHDGDAVFVWRSNLQDGSGYGVYAQRYQESTDTVGAMITDIRANGQTILPWETVPFDVGGFNVGFSELGPLNESSDSPFAHALRPFTTIVMSVSP